MTLKGKEKIRCMEAMLLSSAQHSNEFTPRFSEVTVRKVGRKYPQREGPRHIRMLFNKYKGFLFQPLKLGIDFKRPPRNILCQP